MITDKCKESIVEMLDAEITQGALGVSNNAPQASDTGLISEITSTRQSITGAVSGKQLTITYNLNSVTGNDETYYEYGDFMTNGITTSEVMLNRIVFTGVPKNSALEFQVTNIINVP